MAQHVGVLGSGDVAKVLAAGFKKHGYDVRIGSRDPAKLSQFCKQEGIAAGTFAEVSSFAELVLLAVNGHAAQEALKLAGASNLAKRLSSTSPTQSRASLRKTVSFGFSPDRTIR